MSPGDTTVLYGALPKQLRFSPEEKRILRNFARLLAQRLLNGRAFSCFISDDRELRRLNNQFLNLDYATDVLSFPTPQQNGMVGDIAISIERAEAQAVEFGHTLMDEIRILMLHGLLHLTGMDHEQDRGEMAGAEHRWREELELPGPLLSRASISDSKR
ncbi:MAG: rRNA maturation RNase YbeY [Acidobacteriaceae bacterium]|nr:rRNA maturation RNase YbeY [Acidobacteriaceae bacterium]